MRKMMMLSLVAAILSLPWLTSRVLSMLLSLYLIGVVASPQLFSCPQLLSAYLALVCLQYCQRLSGGFLCL